MYWFMGFSGKSLFPLIRKSNMLTRSSLSSRSGLGSRAPWRLYSVTSMRASSVLFSTWRAPIITNKVAVSGTSHRQLSTISHVLAIDLD
jgi:hypothetical protein